MNARELLTFITPHKPVGWDEDQWLCIVRAAKLLAAAEANDGATAETDIARAIDQLNLVAVGLEPTFSVSAKWVKGAIALIEALRNERNGLAARVVELEKDVRRLDWLASNYAYVMGYADGPEKGMRLISDPTGAGNLRAAIDAARSKP